MMGRAPSLGTLMVLLHRFNELSHQLSPCIAWPTVLTFVYKLQLGHAHQSGTRWICAWVCHSSSDFPTNGCLCSKICKISFRRHHQASNHFVLLDGQCGLQQLMQSSKITALCAKPWSKYMRRLVMNTGSRQAASLLPLRSLAPTLD